MIDLPNRNGSRREFLAGGLATVLAFSRTMQSFGADAARGWNWDLLVPNNDEAGDAVPVPRDPWNGMLAYEDELYLFGGVFPRYGPPTGPGDLTTMGSLNDLWRFDLVNGAWSCLEADDGQALFDESTERPCGRVLPCWAEVRGSFYLFGGLTAFGEGWQTRLLNDLWCYDPKESRWTLLEPDDGRQLHQPAQVDAGRPTALSAMGTAVIGDTIFILAGWGGQQPSVVLSEQLWAYDVVEARWDFLGHSEQGQPWPPKRYCPAFTEWDGKLYLWGGRDSEDRTPQWYNDLWMYDPAAGQWEQLAETGGGGTDESAGKPAARYGMGQARVGSDWFIMGGFGNETGNSPQLNDLWRLDLASGRWSLLEPMNGAKDVSPSAARPCVRRVPAMTSTDGSVYLFGGLDLTSGPDENGPIIGFNDLWRGSVA